MRFARRLWDHGDAGCGECMGSVGFVIWVWVRWDVGAGGGAEWSYGGVAGCGRPPDADPPPGISCVPPPLPSWCHPSRSALGAGRDFALSRHVHCAGISVLGPSLTRVGFPLARAVEVDRLGRGGDTASETGRRRTGM